MKKSFHLHSLIILLSFLLILASCRDNSVVLADKITSPTEIDKTTEPSPATEIIDQVFSHLSQVDNLAELSLHEQFMLMQSYATEKGIDFNINHANFQYEAGVALTTDNKITKEEEFLMSELEVLKDLIELHGLTPALVEAIQVYKSELLASLNKDHEIPVNYINSALAFADQTSLMVTNDGFRRYIGATAPALLQANLERINWGCIWANLALAGAIAGCSAGYILSCAAVVTAQLAVLENCLGGTTVDPCLNSPNPCCGVHCASGFYCNTNGDCVLDPNDPGCINNGCPPGQVCAGNTCIPL